MRLLLPLLLAICLLTCSPDDATGPLRSAHSVAVDTTSLDSFRLWEWSPQWIPQWEIVSVSPLSTRYVPDSRYTGYVSVQPGPIEGQYIHWYQWIRGDTLRIDVRIRIRCRRTTIPSFEEVRVLIPMTSQLPTPLDVTMTVPGTEKRFLVPRGYLTRIRDPEAINPDSGREIDIEYGQWLPIPTLIPCSADSVPVTIRIANLLDSNKTLPPRPFWAWFELRNRQAFQTVVGKIAIGIAVTEPRPFSRNTLP